MNYFFAILFWTFLAWGFVGIFIAVKHGAAGQTFDESPAMLSFVASALFGILWQIA